MILRLDRVHGQGGRGLQEVGFLILTNRDPEEWCVTLYHTCQVIGRSSRCEIPVPARFSHVSRRHAEITGDRHGIKIRDLDSRSGTRVNGVWVRDGKKAALVFGDRVWLGGLELEFVAEVPRAAEVRDRSDVSGAESQGYAGGTLPLPAQMLATLSQAELAIVLWIGRGYFKDEEIAAKLFRSPNTVRTQINSIFRKLNIRSRSDIISLIKRCE